MDNINNHKLFLEHLVKYGLEDWEHYQEAYKDYVNDEHTIAVNPSEHTCKLCKHYTGNYNCDLHILKIDDLVECKDFER